MIPRTTKAALGTLGLALLGACGGGDYGGGGAEAATDFSGFCAEVLPRVDAFVSRMERELSVADSSRYGGTAVVGGIGEFPDGMNHFVATNYETNDNQRHVHGTTLLKYDANFELVPYLAESWELDDPENPTAVTFRIHSDVYWHDGEKLDAEDVAFTYRTITNPETAYANLNMFDNWVHGAEGVEVLDSVTVRIKIARPHAEIMDPWWYVVIMPEHLLGDVPVTQLKQHPFGTQCPVGSGPFVFVEHRPQESWTFKANPAFPASLGGRPYLDRYVYRVIPEQTTLLTDLLTENIDVFLNPRPDQVPQIQASRNLEVRSFAWPAYTLIAWNARRPQLADARVRRALTMGINRAELVEAQLRGFGAIANTGVHPLHFAYDPGLAGELPYDPAAAARLLDEAGWTDRNGDGVRENADGVRLELTMKYNQGNQRREDIAEVAQAQLGQIGVRVTPQVMEFGTMIDQMSSTAREFDAAVFGWNLGLGRIDDTALFHSSSYDTPYGFAGTRNPRMDALMDTLKLIPDRTVSLPLWREYQRLVVQEQPYTFMYFDERIEGINRRLRGVEMDARGEMITARSWWIPREQRGGSVAAR